MPKSTSFANSLLELVLKATTFADFALPPGGGTKRVTFSRGLDGKIVGAETKED